MLQAGHHARLLASSRSDPHSSQATAGLRQSPNRMPLGRNETESPGCPRGRHHHEGSTIDSHLCLRHPDCPVHRRASPGRFRHPSQKQIGTVKPEVEPALIVMNSAGAKLEGNRLVLTGVAPNSIIFADRPVRAAGHILTAHLLEE